jgi:DNA-directed RNA polymerase subunit RPC12/RpoP/ribosomal protein S27AE
VRSLGAFLIALLSLTFVKTTTSKSVGEKSMSETLNLDKCPNCGGIIAPDKSGRLVCEYCGERYSYEQLRSDFADSQDKDFSEYTCSHCGAEIVTDSLNIVSRCAYCGCTSVMKNRISGEYRPDFIMPFKLTKTDAENILQTTVKGKNFVKKSFRRELEIKDVTPLFVPFWLYDCEVVGEGKYTPTNGKNTCRIRFSERYEKIPVDASLRLDDNYMDVLEPFDYADLKPFDKAYMIGAAAERYDTAVKIMGKRADKKAEKAAKTSLANRLSQADKSMENQAISAVANVALNTANTVANKVTNGIENGTFSGNVNFKAEDSGIGEVTYIDRIKHFKARVKTEKYYYALFPVYLIRCEYRRKNYIFAVNGQTGKIAGKFEFSMANYVLQNLAGYAIGTLMFSAVVFFALRKPLKSLVNIPLPLAFAIIFAASFLFISALEITHGGGFSLNLAKEYLGQKPTVANAKYYRVEESFKKI